MLKEALENYADFPKVSHCNACSISADHWNLCQMLQCSFSSNSLVPFLVKLSYFISCANPCRALDPCLLISLEISLWIWCVSHCFTRCRDYQVFLWWLGILCSSSNFDNICLLLSTVLLRLIVAQEIASMWYSAISLGGVWLATVSTLRFVWLRLPTLPFNSLVNLYKIFLSPPVHFRDLTICRAPKLHHGLTST